MDIIVNAIIAVGGLLLGAGIKALIDWRKAQPEIDVIQAQADETEAKADKVKAEVLVMLIQSYQSSLNNMNDRVTRYESQIASMRCEIDNITTSRELAQKERDEVKAKVATMERDIDNLTRERDNTQQQRDSLQVKVFDLENKRIPAMERRIEQLKQIVIKLGGELPPTGPLGEQP